MDDFPWSIVISAVTGGAAGAIITHYATKARSKRDLALKFVDQYVDERFSQLVAANALMDDPVAMAQPGSWDQVASIANWFEVVAGCYLLGYADNEVLECMGLDERCEILYSSLCDTKHVTGQTPSGEQITENSFEQEHLDSLPQLRRLAEKVRQNRRRSR